MVGRKALIMLYVGLDLDLLRDLEVVDRFFSAHVS